MAESASLVQLEPDDDRGYIISTCLWVFTSTAILLQIGRTWSRIRLRQLGWDDYWMYITTALLLAFAIVIQISMLNGGGRHTYHIIEKDGLESALYLAKLSWISQPFCIMAVGTGKISVAMLIMRFLYNQQKWLRVSLWICLISCNVFLIIAIFLTFFQCNPPQKLWTPTLPGLCWDPSVQTNFSIFAASWSAAADMFLAVLPLAVIRGLQLRIEKKIGLCFIFSLGILAGICGFYKVSRLPGLGARGDITWNSYDALLFTGAEIWLIIICGTVPTVKPLWDWFFGRLRNASSRYQISRSGARKLDDPNASEDRYELRSEDPTEGAQTQIEAQYGRVNPSVSKPDRIIVQQTIDVESRPVRG